MSCDIVLGGQWGDEGKAKIIDYLSANYQTIARFQGGANAGHTVKVGNKKYVFHLIPSGILYPKSTCVLGNGVVIDLQSLLQEINQIRDQGIEVEGRLKISSMAFTVLPFHIALDKAREAYNGGKIGTTCRGIGPAYQDKIIRSGIRIGDLYNGDKLQEKIEESLVEKNVLFEHLFGVEKPDIKAIVDQTLSDFEKIKPFVCNSPYFFQESLSKGNDILLEGAQGAGLDLDFGSYPFVTSSNTTSGGAITGTGIGPKNIGEIIGVFKAYITRVGGGRLPTQLSESEMKVLQDLGQEFGATTGRPRACGWFDGVQARYSAIINGLTQIALTKIDVLDSYKKVYFAKQYRINGKLSDHYPDNLKDFENAEPIYQEFEGWQKPTMGIKTYSDLPDMAKRYLDALEKQLQVPIKYLSNGPERSETIVI